MQKENGQYEGRTRDLGPVAEFGAEFGGQAQLSCSPENLWLGLAGGVERVLPELAEDARTATPPGPSTLEATPADTRRRPPLSI